MPQVPLAALALRLLHSTETLQIITICAVTFGSRIHERGHTWGSERSGLTFPRTSTCSLLTAYGIFAISPGSSGYCELSSRGKSRLNVDSTDDVSGGSSDSGGCRQREAEFPILPQIPHLDQEFGVG